MLGKRICNNVTYELYGTNPFLESERFERLRQAEPQSEHLDNVLIVDLVVDEIVTGGPHSRSFH